ncbi:unnamed protein product [Rhizoctonia solani]|uniref:Alginate lyase domain-containing protein n=3 Tax=Rhizoctonia solani TaxID=456999 RepID=A0A8H3CLG9_9AGAM|nr:chondroitin AC/alginate lyase [Rhizoctonia solani AG-3 Rhs1AP]KEP47486.1 chondroitin AC/alginate lyase [Rhizoctonia solani 123E]CAE6452121.1 unnamed protein product [Rhizoctonia solani]CAE6485972.1 unnamed protein product [Rhizoctonia solani]
MANLFCLSLVAFAFLFVAPALALTSYANEFFTPESVIGSEWIINARWAQTNTMKVAKQMAGQGPWAVTSKSMLPPTGDKHDFISLRPYFWPDCSGVGNTTRLTDQQIYTTCPYVRRDGIFNPDVRMVNDTGAFQAMSDTIFYSALAWSFTKDRVYTKNIASAINTWFLAPETLMNPNVNYGQLLRGPGEQKGSHTGVLDMKCMTKLTSAVLLLRKAKAPEWTQALDDGLNAWVKQYIVWLTTNALALEEKAAPNNHGSFYFNQLASLQLLVGDTEGAKTTINEYFNGIYQDQITANGDQPLESIRTRPYHYRAYNLAAMVVNAKIGAYVGITDAWNRTARSGAGIQKALDYAMSTSPKGEEEYVKELLPPLAAIASVYGDPDGKYVEFLRKADPRYPGSAFYLIAPGLSDSGLLPGLSNSSSGGDRPPPTLNSGAIKVGVSGAVGVLIASAAATFASTL